jgi:acetamidase/formamidase
MENEEWLMVAASARPLMDAFRLGQVELIRWLEQDYGYDPLDALHLITQVGTTRVGNVVDPQFTVVAKFPKRYLPEGESPSHP